MRFRTRILAMLLAASPSVFAHTVVWVENLTGSKPTNTMEIAYGGDSALITVLPSLNEPCTVVVNMDQPSSSLVEVEVITENPAVEVRIRVSPARAPIGGSETATVTGEWHATGQPPDKGCDAILPNRFSVPVRVTAPTPIIASLSQLSGFPGEKITISGRDLNTLTGVSFGNIAAPFTVLNSSNILVTIPRNAPVGQIALVTPNGVVKSSEVFVVRPILHVNLRFDGRVNLAWDEMNYPFTLQCSPSITNSAWSDVIRTVDHQVDLPVGLQPTFYRLVWNPIPLNPVDYNRDRPAVANFYWRDPVNYWAVYGLPALARLALLQQDLSSNRFSAFDGFIQAFDAAKFTNALDTHQLPIQFEIAARNFLTNGLGLTNAYVNTFISLVATNDSLNSCPDMFRTNCLATNALSPMFAKVLTNTASVNTLTNWAPTTNKIFFNPNLQTNAASPNWIDTHGSDAFTTRPIASGQHPDDTNTTFRIKWQDITVSTLWNTTLDGACATVAVGASLAKLGVGPAETTCQFWNELARLMGTTTNVIGAYPSDIAELYKSLGYGCNAAYDGPFESAVEEAKKALARGCDVQLDYYSADRSRGHTEFVHSITIDPNNSSKATISTLSWGHTATVTYSGNSSGGTFSGKSDGIEYRKPNETSSYLEGTGIAVLRYYCKQ